MNVIRRVLKQNAVLWKRVAATDGAQGVFEAPVQIKCRWEDGSVMKVQADGDIKAYTATLMVDRDVAEGDMIILGTLESILDVVDPLGNNGAREILATEKIPTFRATKFLRMAYL